jgi:hypothetical protein
VLANKPADALRRPSRATSALGGTSIEQVPLNGAAVRSVSILALVPASACFSRQGEAEDGGNELGNVDHVAQGEHSQLLLDRCVGLVGVVSIPFVR